MPYFPMIVFQEMILAFFLGLGAFVLLYLAWVSYPEDRPEEMEKERGEQDTRDSDRVPRAAGNPVPPFLLLVYAGLSVWILAYLIIIGLGVKDIG